MRQIVKKDRNSQEPSIYTLVLDMNNIMKISLRNDKVNEDGVVYGMITSALRLIGNVLSKKDFDYCVAAYDGQGSGVLRYRIYQDYKANRNKNYEAIGGESDLEKHLYEFRKKVIAYSKANKKTHMEDVETDDELFERQKPILQSILEELCIRQYEFDNVEGDDIISYYVHNKKKNEKVVIVSADKDLAQLISETVIVYNPMKKMFITKDNALDVLGFRPDNIVLEKIICGDTSDNIKGIKGVGETTLRKLFPEINARRLDLSFIMRRTKELLEERKAQKKKPLRALENILNRITDGIQGKDIYDINQKIVDLSNPLLTDEALHGLSEELYAPMDTTDKSVKNVYDIICKNKMNSLMGEDNFGYLLGPFSRIINMEQRRYEKFLMNVKNC